MRPHAWTLPKWLHEIRKDSDMEAADLMGKELNLVGDSSLEEAEERWLVRAYADLNKTENRPHHAVPIYYLCEERPQDSRYWSMLGYCAASNFNFEAAILILATAARLGSETAKLNVAILKDLARKQDGNCLDFIEPLLDSDDPLGEAIQRSRDNYVAALASGNFEEINYWFAKSVAYHFFNVNPNLSSKNMEFEFDQEAAEAITEKHLTEVREKKHILSPSLPWAELGYTINIPRGFELYYGQRETCDYNFHIRYLNALVSEQRDKVREIVDASPTSPVTVLDIGYYVGKIAAHLKDHDRIAYTAMEANLPISNQLRLRFQKAGIDAEVIHADFWSDPDLGGRTFDIVVALGIIGLCDEETFRKLLQGPIGQARHLIIGDDITASWSNKFAMRILNAGGENRRFAHRYHDLLDEHGFDVVDCTPSKIIANYCNGFLVARKR